MTKYELEQILDNLKIVTDIVNAEEELIDVQAQLAKEKVKSKQWLDKAHTRLLELESTKTMVEALIEVGNVLRDERRSNLHTAFGIQWDDLVTTYRARRA